MNTEAFKLARDTLREAVKDYGYRRRTGADDNPAFPMLKYRYRHGPGKFEGEHWSIVHWYQVMLAGFGDEPLMEGDTVVADVFEVTDTERAAFGVNPGFDFAVLWHSSNGFETLEYVSADGYDKLREQFTSSEDA